MKRTAAILVLVFIFSLPPAPFAYSKIVVFTGGTIIEFPGFIGSGPARVFASLDSREHADVYLFMDATPVVGVIVIENPSIRERVFKVGIKAFIGCVRYSLELLPAETPLNTAARLYAYSVKVLKRWLSGWNPGKGIVENNSLGNIIKPGEIRVVILRGEKEAVEDILELYKGGRLYYLP